MVGHEVDRPCSVLTSIVVEAEAVVIGDQGQGSALSQSLATSVLDTPTPAPPNAPMSARKRTEPPKSD